MAPALHGLTAPAPAAPALRRTATLGLFPALTLLAFALPIVAGLLGTLLPAFGYLPALGGTALDTSPWSALVRAPGFASALRLSLATGWLATALSFMLAVGLVGRVMPQFQIFFAATPLTLILGLSLFALSLGAIGLVWVEAYEGVLRNFI